MNLEELYQELLTHIEYLDYVQSDDIPPINLYMDQVTTFMENHLERTRRYPEDKVLTKTMINNYTKNDLLPPPMKKKYSREHILLLILIYYYKNILSISDIKTILQPLTRDYFQSEGDLCLTDIYEELFSKGELQLQQVQQDLGQMKEAASQVFTDLEEPEREKLQRFAFLSFLSFDVYMKKRMIESIVDEMASENDTNKKKE
jgi:hypothetical protein